jgi:hypothetical protein
MGARGILHHVMISRVDGGEIFRGEQDWQAIIGSGMLIRKQICNAAGKKLGYSESAMARFMGFNPWWVNRYPVSVVTPLRTRP